LADIPPERTFWIDKKEPLIFLSSPETKLNPLWLLGNLVLCLVTLLATPALGRHLHDPGDQTPDQGADPKPWQQRARSHPRSIAPSVIPIVAQANPTFETPPPIPSGQFPGKRAPAPSIERSQQIQEQELERITESTALRGDDERLRPAEQFQIPIGRTMLTITGEISLDVDFQNNFNLETIDKEDELTIEPQAELNFILEFPQGIGLFTEFSIEEEVQLEKAKKPEYTFELQLDEAFANIPLPLPFPSFLRLGRFQIFEKRRWAFTRTFDAVQLLFDPIPFHVRLAAATTIPSSGDATAWFDNIVVDREQFDVIISNTYDLTEKSTLGQYVIVGNNHENRIERRDPRDEDPIWIGLRVFGKEAFDEKRKWLDSDFLEDFLEDLLRPKIKYWLDAAYVTGTVLDKDLSGFGLDVGVSYIARKLPFDPYVTVAYAFGSGDRDPNDGVDRNFRQTGFQSNSGKFGGVANFDYYGVLMDPELSNLHVYTAGLGFRPSRKSSVDVVYHYYRQDVAFDDFRDADVEDPSGKNTDIGEEIDVVVGYREIKNLALRLRAGYFLPGDAYKEGEDDPAFQARFDIKWSF